MEILRRPVRTVSFSAAAVAVGLCAITASFAAPAGAATGPDGHARAAKGGPNQGPTNLVDHGGKILTASKTYAIWWGAPASFPSDAKTGLTSLLSGLGGSSYLQLAQQYMRGAAVTSSYVTSYDDVSSPPSHSPQVRTIVDEVAKMLGPTAVPDPQAIYFVFTSNDPVKSFCAWHSSGTVNGVTVQVAYLPNTDGVAGCDPGDLFGANTFGEGTRSIADSLAHEFMESVTDAVPVTGWADKNGAEIADKCNFVYGAPVRVGKVSWQLQEEWSNATGGCVQDTK